MFSTSSLLLYLLVQIAIALSLLYSRQCVLSII
uniref:Uncharacterized protein n=1 Tax=Siphoviridae sp. ctoOf8 TaxID=2825668 RepID=A0A8S5QH04_9CAUD|nr:MAG TPA: hypothetical protein [Siphoviridae sp. ctoOf8]